MWVTNIGEQKFKENIFSDNILKNFEENPFYSTKFLRTFFSHRQLFQKFTPFIQNLLPFLCIFLPLSLFLLSFVFIFFKLKKLKNSRLIIGGPKRGVSPILIIGGACPGCPQSLLLWVKITLICE